MSWSDKDPREILPYGIELASLLAADDSLIAAEATIAVASGTDPNADSMLLGACEIVGTTVQQWLQGGVSGCRYQLTFQADTDVGKRIIETAELAVVTR